MIKAKNLNTNSISYPPLRIVMVNDGTQKRVLYTISIEYSVNRVPEPETFSKNMEERI